MINDEINKDLNILLSFPNEAAPLLLKDSLRIVLGPKPKQFQNMEARRKVGYSYRKKCVCNAFMNIIA